jgi:hypothetical protein
VTYFNGDHRVSLRYPASWRSTEDLHDGSWERTFSPAAGTGGSAPLGATLAAQPFEGTIDELARRYVAGARVVASHDEQREGTEGRSYDLASADGSTRSILLAFRHGSEAVSLRVWCPAPDFGSRESLLREMAKSLTCERPESYPLFRDDRFAVSLRVPASWPESRRFSSAKSLLVQFTSPPFVSDKGGQTAHASLTLTVEALGADETLDSFYAETRERLGSAFEALSHKRWRDGYADLLTAETPLTISRVKRYYRVAGGRGYGLAFEARDDVLPRASRWCELIADTLEVGPEVPPR